MRRSIGQIQVGERRRVDLGAIDELAASIERYGLLHPIVVDDDDRLIAGGRRLKACEQLGWREIDVRSLGELTEAERREIELEENIRRSDLTEYERSRNLTELAEIAATVLTDEFRPDSGQKSRGQPKQAGSLRAVAERVGVPKSTIQEAQAHVETADAYPFMQTWKQYQVLEAHDALEEIPESDRPELAALLAQPGIPAKRAIAIVRNIATKQPSERAHIFELAHSTDSRDRDLALTEAAAMPPMPDPRLTLLDDVQRTVKKAIRMFPNDPANAALANVLDCLKPAYLAVREARRGQ